MTAENILKPLSQASSSLRSTSKTRVAWEKKPCIFHTDMITKYEMAALEHVMGGDGKSNQSVEIKSV